MKIEIINESGFEEALLGVSLSYNSKPSKRVADKLAWKGEGESKFLESMVVWIDATLPRYLWQQVDTYRVGISKQSESTMHTLLRKEITEDMFEGEDTSVAMITMLNAYRIKKNLVKLKQHLPESFLQRRIICTNYAVLQNMYRQRSKHKLDDWRTFLIEVLHGVEYPEYVGVLYD